MKKLLSLVLAFALVLSLAAVVSFAEDEDEAYNREVTIYKIATAPKIDGVIEDGEYYLISEWPLDNEIISRGDYAENIKVYIYMCYDDENIYYAVKTECDEPHSAYMDNASEHYVFNAHYLMTLIIPDDPANGSYPGTEATWSDLYNGNFAYEWTTIFASEATSSHGADEAFATDHFQSMSSLCTYAANSADGWDYYEIAIPFTAMTNSVNTTALTAEEGTVFGFDCTIGLTDIGTGYDGGEEGYKGNYIYFGNGYSQGSKDLSHTARITLGGEAPADIDDPDEMPANPGKNLIEGKTYTFEGNTRNAAGAEDGFADTDADLNVKGRLTDGVVATNADDIGAYGGGVVSFTVDMGEVTEFTGFAAQMLYGSWGVTAVNSVEYAVSDDGTNWTVLGKVGAGTQEASGDWIQTNSYLAAEASGRYVKFTVDSTNYTWISEIQAFGADEDAPVDPTPATGDAGVIALAIVSVIALGGAVIVKKSK